MFKGYKIKKLLSQLSLAGSEDSRSELISQISEIGKAAFPYVSEAFRNKQLTAIHGSALLEELYDESLADDLLALTGDKYDAVRGAAKKLVLLKANSKIVKKLIENLESPNSYLKISSTELLCEIKTQSCVLDLVSLFNRGGADVKLNVINILAATGGDIAVKLLINALKSKEWRIRVRAVKSLGKMKSNKSVEPLMEILSEKDPQMKKSALDALMQIGDKKIAPSVLSLLRDEDLMIRQKAVDCIYEIGDSQVIPQVLELMQEKDVNIRRCAIEIINKMKDPKAGEALVKAMKDSDWWVRNVAMEALAEIKGENTVSILIAMLNDSDENIRRCAVEFFNRVSDPSAVEPLIGLLNDKDWWVREKTVSALGRLKDPRAIKPLTKLINDEEIKWVIPGALAKIGGKEVIGPIVEFLGDDQKRVRIEAIRALSALKFKEEIIPEIKHALEDHNEEVRSEATKALKSITGRIFEAKDNKTPEQLQVKKVFGVNHSEGSILSEAIVVVDLCNSTNIANKYGDEFALNLTNILTDAVNPIARRQKVQFMKSTGDGFLVTFPKIKNAVQFAADLKNKIGKYNETVEESKRIDLRFAINCGETRIDAKGDRLGVATNMTFRVEGVKAENLIEVEDGIKKEEVPSVNRVFITENVVEEAEQIEGFKARLVGLFELKGITGLHRIYDLTKENGSK